MGLSLLGLGVGQSPAQASETKAASQCGQPWQYQFLRLQDEKPVSLCQFQGKVMFVVNTASFCGFTLQYEALEKLHQRYSAQGFSVVGFPSNDFGRQEPKSNSEIADFCSNTFGVKFPMMAKTHVIGPQANSYYQHLLKQTGQAPTWNFFKYLVGRDGRVIRTYASDVSPTDSSLMRDVEKALAQKG